ncbi:MAG: type II secretion system GspH family protein [Candidatus Gastranaerophilales bacterium]|nr:type II secretion system GspH family protein [Candidatus Gastranaerophilales bacterium]
MAEVLITLVIIGIIAAVTVPTLMANYRKKETSAKLKKFYSNLSQAVRLSQIENQRFIKDGLSTCNGSDLPSCDWWKESIGKYLPLTKTNALYTYSYNCNSGGCGQPYTRNNVYSLNDGSAITWMGSVGQGSIYILYDINGYKSPNIYNKDIFRFNLQAYDDTPNNIHWTKVCGGWSCIHNSTCSGTNTTSACSNGVLLDNCSHAIQCNGWELD